MGGADNCGDVSQAEARGGDLEGEGGATAPGTGRGIAGKGEGGRWLQADSPPTKAEVHTSVPASGARVKDPGAWAARSQASGRRRIAREGLTPLASLREPLWLLQSNLQSHKGMHCALAR